MRDWKVYRVVFGSGNNHGLYSVTVLAKTVSEATKKAERFAKSRPDGAIGRFRHGDYAEECSLRETIDVI